MESKRVGGDPLIRTSKRLNEQQLQVLCPLPSFVKVSKLMRRTILSSAQSSRISHQPGTGSGAGPPPFIHFIPHGKLIS
ncbi:hypothetical protein CEXT_505201 [Caerostris extrusa]|uniref:Uncharacterized protein n=1 Tax=Caerostris extrusa TaxID=172846 RepID=A0AAV4NB22_CAEEX|nr:hypothetical protein CEXT_505201 [Caerostris extrusa]